VPRCAPMLLSDRVLTRRAGARSRQKRHQVRGVRSQRLAQVMATAYRQQLR
jgi:hypothetical protein